MFLWRKQIYITVWRQAFSQTYVCFCDANKYISTFEGKLSANTMFISVTQTIYTVFVSATANKCMSTFEGKLSPITCFCDCKQVYIYCVCFCGCMQVYVFVSATANKCMSTFEGTLSPIPCSFLRLKTNVYEHLKVSFHRYCVRFCDCMQVYILCFCDCKQVYIVFVSATTFFFIWTFEGKLSPYYVCFCGCKQVHILCLFLRLRTS